MIGKPRRVKRLKSMAAALPEWAILIALVTIITVAAFGFLGASLNNSMTDINQTIEGVNNNINSTT